MAKYMDLNEFVDMGFLQEANRRFFHPLGLALEGVVDDNTGEVTLGGIWDYRDDPTGIMFTYGVLNTEKAKHVEALMHSKLEARNEENGVVNGIQQI